MASEYASPEASQMTRALFDLVLNDLLEDERISNIEQQFDESLQLFYMRALKTFGEQQRLMTFIPTPHGQCIDFEVLHALQSKLQKCTICVAIVDNTGNILYYVINEDFIE